MFLNSISLRLVVGASLWITGALVLTGVVLNAFHCDHVEQEFDSYLSDHAKEIFTLTDVDGNGQPYLKRHPADPRFNDLFSGWYWQMHVPGRHLSSSRSLGDGNFPEPAVWPRGKGTIYVTDGPRNQSLRVYARTFTMPDSDQKLLILVAGSTAEIEKEINAFSNAIKVILTLLGLGLIGAIVLQVRFGLKPLRRMSQTLSDIRAGHAARIEGPMPVEIAPLAKELNALLDYITRVSERARTQADDLAHMLKTPLTVLRNEGERIEGEAGEVVRQQIALMNARVSHHVFRARVAGLQGILGARTEVCPVIEGLRRTLLRIFEDRHIDIDFSVTKNPYFQGDRQDLEEMLGNLMENGCKWSRQRIRVHGELENGELNLIVEDDGPGIPVKLRSDVLDRGRRLDESTPGSGLGLSIVREMAELYGGSLKLEESPLGGLLARLRFPAAEA